MAYGSDLVYDHCRGRSNDEWGVVFVTPVTSAISSGGREVVSGLELVS